MCGRILPPEDAPQGGIDWPLSLEWSGDEYDVYLRNGQAPDEDVLIALRAKLNENAETSDARWGIIDRGEGRINLLPPSRTTSQHEHVAAVVTRLFAKDFLE